MCNIRRMDEIRRINYLSSEMQMLYHQASLKLGLSDSVSLVLYTIYDRGDGCLLSDVYKDAGISKQTVNSAMRRLEKEKVLSLAPDKGRTKRIWLTQAGRELIQRTVARLADAESHAFDDWSEEEIETHIRYLEKYLESLRMQIKQM